MPSYDFLKNMHDLWHTVLFNLTSGDEVGQFIQQEQPEPQLRAVEIEGENVGDAPDMVDDIVAVHVQQRGGFGELAVEAEIDEQYPVIVGLVLGVVAADVVEYAEIALLAEQEHIGMEVAEEEKALFRRRRLEHVVAAA